MICKEVLYRMICADGECAESTPRCETREELIEIAKLLGWEESGNDRWFCARHAQAELAFCDKAKQL